MAAAHHGCGLSYVPSPGSKGWVTGASASRPAHSRTTGGQTRTAGGAKTHPGRAGGRKARPHRSARLLAQSRDLHELVRVQTRAADEGTVDVRLIHNLRD